MSARRRRFSKRGLAVNRWYLGTFSGVALLLLAGPELGGQGTAAKPDLAARARAALAQLEGTLLVHGVRERVEVLRDRWGIPHIYAQNVHDLFLAQGFVAAQDRMWQLEMWRRQGEGKLAEVLGPDYVTRDQSRACSPSAATGMRSSESIIPRVGALSTLSLRE
jgi:acyl-homoserine lactone acylase PvdQ